MLCLIRTHDMQGMRAAPATLEAIAVAFGLAFVGSKAALGWGGQVDNKSLRIQALLAKLGGNGNNVTTVRCGCLLLRSICLASVLHGRGA
jgi:hypothetical protein